MILVLNLGLKSIRAIVFDQNGQKIKSVSKPINTLLRGDFVEQDPEEWWQKAIDVIKEAILERDIRSSLRSMTITSSSSCLVPVNLAGRAVTNCIMVSDKRSVRQVEQLKNMIEYLGVNRIMFGSDFPWFDYNKELQGIINLDLSKHEKAKILYHNASKIIGIKNDPEEKLI